MKLCKKVATFHNCEIYIERHYEDRKDFDKALYDIEGALQILKLMFDSYTKLGKEIEE